MSKRHGPATRHRPGRPTLPYEPSIPGQSYQFVGTLATASLPSDPRLLGAYAQFTFAVLAGEGAPTLAGGFAKWGVIDRPRRVGMTVLQGYDPMTMDVPVRFDDVIHQAGVDLERDIQMLHWMAGRGKLFAADGHVGASGKGDSPIVNVYSSDSHGKQTPLIPPDVWDIDWVITGLTFDPSPIRNTAGRRIRQDVTVTLTQYVGSPGTALDSPTVRARARQSITHQFVSFPVTHAHNTIRKITTFDAHNPSHAAAVQVLKANKARLRLGSSIDAPLIPHLKPGTKINVPKSVVLSR
jgi:hypothetical protein